MVFVINLIAIDQPRILIVDRHLDSQISKRIYLEIHFLPSGKFIRINVFDQIIIIISHSLLFIISLGKIAPRKKRTLFSSNGIYEVCHWASPAWNGQILFSLVRQADSPSITVLLVFSVDAEQFQVSGLFRQLHVDPTMGMAFAKIVADRRLVN